MYKYSVILTNVGSCSDRYMQSGYGRSYTTRELFERLNRIEGINGVELIGGANITRDSVSDIKELLEEFNLEAVSIIPDHFGRAKWGKGAFASPDGEIREDAIRETYEMIDAAKQIGCGIINIWNGQDGYDYPLQVDYDQTYNWLVEGIRACADYDPSIRIALEYKPKEPRTHSFISNVFSTLSLIDDVGRDNVGLTIDTGHSLMAYENMAEAVCAASRKDKLFHMHFNDNYRFWDDDMISGSVHTVEYLELFHWLKKCKYTGWLSVDQYPYREDSVRAVEESLKWLRTFANVVDGIDCNRLRAVFDSQDATAATELMRELIFK